MVFLSEIKDIKVMFGLDPDIQVKQGIKNSLDPRVYSSLTLGHEDDRGDAAGAAGGSQVRLVLPPPYGF